MQAYTEKTGRFGMVLCRFVSSAKQKDLKMGNRHKPNTNRKKSDKDTNSTQDRHKTEWFLFKILSIMYQIWVALVSNLCRATPSKICIFCIEFVSCRTYCFCCILFGTQN